MPIGKPELKPTDDIMDDGFYSHLIKSAISQDININDLKIKQEREFPELDQEMVKLGKKALENAAKNKTIQQQKVSTTTYLNCMKCDNWRHTNRNKRECVNLNTRKIRYTFEERIQKKMNRCKCDSFIKSERMSYQEPEYIQLKEE